MRPSAWPGIIVATIGAALATWSFTGDRSYDLVYVPVLLVGLVLMTIGSWWAARNRAKQGRMARAKPKAQPQPKPKRVRQPKPKPAPKPRMRYELQCPSCHKTLHVVTSGPRPTDADCPHCGHDGSVHRERTLPRPRSNGTRRRTTTVQATKAAPVPERPRHGPQRYTLQCPRCRNVMDLRSTSTPEAVRCPHCGHTGKVRSR